MTAARTLPYVPLEDDATSSTKIGVSAARQSASDDEAALRSEVAELRIKLAKLDAQESGHLSKAREHLVAAGQSVVHNALKSVAGCFSTCGAGCVSWYGSLCQGLWPSSPFRKNKSPRKKTIAAGGPDYAPAAAAAHKGPVMISEDDWEQHRHRGLLFPCGPLKFKWDALVFALIVYSCVVVPFRIGMNHPPEGIWWQFEFLITICFISDLIANFFTAYREGDQFVVSKPMIQQNYLTGWFIIDLPSSFPTELFSIAVDALAASGFIAVDLGDEDGAVSSHLKILRALRLVRLLRLLRLLKVQEYIDKLEDELQISLQALQLVKVVCGLLYITHILGCFWFWTASMSPESSWLTSYDDGSGVDADVWTQYLYSVYFTFTTLTTVGYGDVTPTNNDERAYALFCQLIGAFVFGYILSTVAELVSNVDPNAVKIEEKLSEVRVYLRFHKFPSDLTTRVKRYFEFYFSRKSAMDEEAIINSMAPSLRKEVLTHLLNKNVSKMAALKSLSLELKLEVQPMLKPMVREAKETIFAKNGIGLSLFFLSKGRVGGKGDMGFEFFEVSAVGAQFGEHCLMRKRSQYTAVAKTRCELYAISLKDIFSLTSRLDAAQRDAMAEVIYDAYTLRLRRTTMMMRFRFNSIKERALREADPTERLVQMEEVEALRLQTRWAQRRAAAATDTTDRFDVLLPRLYADTYVDPDVEVEQSRAPTRLESPRATTIAPTPRAETRLQQLDAMAIPVVGRAAPPTLLTLPAAASSATGGESFGSLPSGRSGRVRYLPSFRESLSSMAPSMAPSAATSARSSPEPDVPPIAAPRVANAILGPDASAQLQRLLADQLAAHSVAMREMVQEVVRSELELRGVTKLGVTSGQMFTV